MCVKNNKETTKYVLNNFKFCGCMTYKVFVIIILIFGYLSAIGAWILISQSALAKFADTAYSLGMILATFTFILNSYYYIIVLIATFILDILIELFALIIIATQDDWSIVFADYEPSLSRTQIMIPFAVYVIGQTVLVGFLIKIVRDIQNETKNDRERDAKLDQV